MNAIEAVAEAWASIDGKLEEYRRGKRSADICAYGGHYAGYTAEAREMIARMEARGFTVAPLPGTGDAP